MSIILNTKRGESQRIIFFILAAIVVIVLFYFAMTSLRSIRSGGIAVDVAKFSSDMRGITDRMTDDYASARDEEVTVQEDVNEVCILDLFHRIDILKSPVIEGYPVIKNSLMADVQKNVFLFKDGQFVNSLFVGDFCYQDYPFFDCYEIDQTQKLSLNVEGKGTCAQITQAFKRCTDVTLESSRTTKEIFLEIEGASLRIPSATQPQFPNGAKQAKVCIEAVPLEANDLASEVYRLSPENTIIHSGSPELRINFKKSLIPENIDWDLLTIKYLDQNKWDPFETSIDDNTREAAPVDFSSFGKYAVFLPGRPTAIISSPTEEDVYPYTEVISFEGSDSYDAEDDNLDFEWDLGDESPVKNEPSFIYQYSKPGVYTVKLKVTNFNDVSDETEVKVNVHSPNKKNETKYEEDPIFLIYKNEPLVDLLSLIPVASWNDFLDAKLKKYNYYAYYGFSSNYENWKLDELMSKHGSEKIHWFWHSSAVPEVVKASPLYPKILENFVDYNHITQYWELFRDVVLVARDAGDDNTIEQMQLLAALYASFINAPVFYVDATNWGEYGPSLLSNPNLKRAYIVGTLDASILFQLTSAGIETMEYTLEDLTDPTINPYVSLTGQIFPSFFVGDDLFMGALDGEILYCSFDDTTYCLHDGEDVDFINIDETPIDFVDAKVVRGASLSGNDYLYKDNPGFTMLERLSGSIAFWVKLDDLQSTHYILSDRSQFRVYVENSILNVEFGNNKLTAELDESWTTNFKLVVIRWNVLSDKMSLTIGNVPVDEIRVTDPGFTLKNTLGIGNKFSFEVPLNGVIDELRIFDKYLSTAEIEEGLIR